MELKKYSHGGRERFSVAIIAGANVVGDFTCHFAQVCVLSRCRRGEEQEQLDLLNICMLYNHPTVPRTCFDVSFYLRAPIITSILPICKSY